jgi:hypothetical protein
LERVCLEGTRPQAKYAVSAIAALFDTSKQLSSLCKVCLEIEVEVLHLFLIMLSSASHELSDVDTRVCIVCAFLCLQNLILGTNHIST